MWKIEDHPPLVCHPVFQHKRHLLACNWHYPVSRSQEMSHFLLQRSQVQRLFPLSSSRMGDIKQHPPLLSYPVYSRKHRLKACTQHYPVCKPRQMSNLFSSSNYHSNEYSLHEPAAKCGTLNNTVRNS